MPRFVALFLVFALLLRASSVWATDPDRVEWSPDWPRVRLIEVLDIVAFTVASLELDAQRYPRDGVRGGILFDDWVRKELRGRTLSAQQTASDLADEFYRWGVYAPYIVDIFFVDLGVHQNADVALQMLLINMQSLGVAGVVSLGAEHLVGRARPFVEDCGPGGKVRDNAGNIVHECSDPGAYRSFYSGHAAAVATAAGLTCVHHQHLPLYGGGLADLAPCVVMIGAAAATGVGRIVSDLHWSSDVLLGWLVGAASGYVLPSVLHYGFRSGGPIGEVQVGGARMVPVPHVYAGGAGLGLVGSF
jgi:membrane-associated phospholipid phosphatase